MAEDGLAHSGQTLRHLASLEALGRYGGKGWAAHSTCQGRGESEFPLISILSRLTMAVIDLIIIPSSFFFSSHKTDSESTHLKRKKEAREAQRGPFCDSRARTRKSCICIIFLASLLLIRSSCFMLMKRTFLLPFRCQLTSKTSVSPYFTCLSSKVMVVLLSGS